MLPMFAKFLVPALITSVPTFAGLFAGVQPRSRLSFGPTVAPFGPQACSGTMPVLVAGLNAPTTMVPSVGSMTASPPSQVIGPDDPSKLQPIGLLAMIGTET